MNEVKIHIYAVGESEACIPSYHETITIQHDLDYDSEERERVRGIFKRAFSELLDDRVSVWFGDECPDCLAVDGKHKDSCPSQTYELEGK
jgi:hypothetical protein